MVNELSIWIHDERIINWRKPKKNNLFSEKDSLRLDKTTKIASSDACATKKKQGIKWLQWTPVLEMRNHLLKKYQWDWGIDRHPFSKNHLFWRSLAVYNCWLASWKNTEKSILVLPLKLHVDVVKNLCSSQG